MLCIWLLLLLIAVTKSEKVVDSSARLVISNISGHMKGKHHNGMLGCTPECVTPLTCDIITSVCIDILDDTDNEALNIEMNFNGIPGDLMDEYVDENVSQMEHATDIESGAGATALISSREVINETPVTPLYADLSITSTVTSESQPKWTGSVGTTCMCTIGARFETTEFNSDWFRSDDAQPSTRGKYVEVYNIPNSLMRGGVNVGSLRDVTKALATVPNKYVNARPVTGNKQSTGSWVFDSSIDTSGKRALCLFGHWNFIRQAVLSLGITISDERTLQVDGYKLWAVSEVDSKKIIHSPTTNIRERFAFFPKNKKTGNFFRRETGHSGYWVSMY